MLHRQALAYLQRNGILGMVLTALAAVKTEEEAKEREKKNKKVAKGKGGSGNHVKRIARRKPCYRAKNRLRFSFCLRRGI